VEPEAALEEMRGDDLDRRLGHGVRERLTFAAFGVRDRYRYGRADTVVLW
jgi:hypothetical protein